MKVKHLVSISFVSLVVLILFVSGFITTQKQKAALNTIKSSYSYSSTALPKDVNVYERKIENPCAGKTCGCGKLPACQPKDPCAGKTCGCGSLPACVDPCKGKTCGCGNLPACSTINNRYNDNNEETAKTKTSKKQTRGTLLNYDKNKHAAPTISKRYKFVVEGDDASQYTMILSSSSKYPTYYHPNAKKKVDYCTTGSDHVKLAFEASKSNNRPVPCSVLILKANTPQVRDNSLFIPAYDHFTTCHIAKGSNIIKRLPMSQCKNTYFNLP